jgi:hypothetical protein
MNTPLGERRNEGDWGIWDLRFTIYALIANNQPMPIADPQDEPDRNEGH